MGNHKFVIAVVMLFLSCRKDRDSRWVKLSAQCRMCAIEYTDNDDTPHFDTIIGTITWTDASGTLIPDTTQGTGTWNVWAEDGTDIRLAGCRLRSDTLDGSIRLYIGGNVPERQTTADFPQQCASLSVTVSQ